MEGAPPPRERGKGCIPCGRTPGKACQRDPSSGMASARGARGAGARHCGRQSTDGAARMAQAIYSYTCIIYAGLRHYTNTTGTDAGAKMARAILQVAQQSSNRLEAIDIYYCDQSETNTTAPRTCICTVHVHHGAVL